MGFCLLLGVLVWPWASSSPLWAKPAGHSLGDPGTEQAKKDVVVALSVGNPGHAEEIIDRAFRANPDPTFLYQLGLVAQAQKRTVAALDLYRRYQELVGAAASAETSAAIQSFAASQTTPVTEVNVLAPPGMLLCMDEKIVGMLPLGAPLLVAGGSHRFRLENRNEQYESGMLVIPEGREAELRLTPGAKKTAVALLSLFPTTLLVLPPQRMDPAKTQAVYKAMVDAVRRNHLAPLPQKNLDAPLAKQPADCLEQLDCRYAIAEEAQARSVLRIVVKEADPAITPAAAGSCTTQLEYLDVNAGEVAARGETTSPACTGAPLADALAAALQAMLREADARPRGMVSISSVPDGVRIRVDGLLRGQTPYLKPSFRGTHAIRADKDGFQSFQTRVEVIPDHVVAAQIELTALPKEEPEPAPAPLSIVPVAAPQRMLTTRWQPRPRWRLWLGGTAVGGGVLLSGLGISALSLNGQCGPQMPAAGETCDRYSTSAVGGGLLGAGLALTAAGVVLLAVPGPRESVGGPVGK